MEEQKCNRNLFGDGERGHCVTRIILIKENVLKPNIFLEVEGHVSLVFVAFFLSSNLEIVW